MKLLKLITLLGIFATHNALAVCSVRNGFSTGEGTQPSTILFNSNLNYAYVLLGGSNQILTYSYDKATGKLTKLNIVVDSGGLTPGFGSTFSQNGKNLYVANTSSSNIAVFSVDASTGKLTLIQTVNSTHVYPYVISISPEGKYLYASAFDSNVILMYKINATDGTISKLTTAKNSLGYVNTLTKPFVPSFSPTGKYLYVPSYGQNSLIRFNYDSTTGDLTRDNQFVINQNIERPFGVLFDPTNTHAIIPADMRNELRLYDFNNEVFTPNKNQPSIATGLSPNTFMQWYVNDKYTYMGNYDDSTISQYKYAKDGTMKLISNFKTITRPIVVRQPSDPQNNHLFVISRDENCIADYSVNPTSGVLEPRLQNTNATVNPNT